MYSSPDRAELPVLVNPARLKFVADEYSTHKQTLTIYNPFQFAVNYKSEPSYLLFYDLISFKNWHLYWFRVLIDIVCSTKSMVAIGHPSYTAVLQQLAFLW